MKAKKLVAFILGATLVTSTAIGLTACKKDKDEDKSEYTPLGTTTLNISDYAADVSEELANYSAKAYTKSKKLTEIDQTKIRNISNELVIYENANGKYNVYNLALEKDVLSGLDNVPQSNTINGGGYQLNVLKVADATVSGAYKIYMTDGTLLLDNVLYNIYGNTMQGYVGNDKERSTIFCISGMTVSDTAPSVQVDKYLKIEEDELTGKKTYTVINASDIKLYSSEYNKGESTVAFPRPIYESTEEKPVEGEINNYKYSYYGDVLEYYKNGTKTGTVDLKNKEIVGKVANYLYYAPLDMVSPDATEGYNYVETYESGAISKYNYTLYQYDIFNNTTVELKYNVVIENITPLYNYTTKSYDSAIITGEEMVNDVAYSENREFTYATDKDLKVGYDLTGYNFPDDFALINLGNDLYMVGSDRSSSVTIINKDLQLVNSVYTNNIANLGDNLITIYVGNYYGFTDVSGKVVIEPKYTSGYGSGSIMFCSGVAYVIEHSVTGEDKELLIKADGTVVKDLTALETSSNPNADVDVQVANGYYRVKTTTTTEDETTHVQTVSVKYEYYSFNGTLLLKAEGLGLSDYVKTLHLDDGSVVICVPVTDATGGNVTYEIHKLSY